MQIILATFMFLAQFSPEQKQEIETIIREYLISHPQVLLEAGEELQRIESEKIQKQAEAAIIANEEVLFNSKSPSLGNEKGTVTIVEFIDYQCTYCKKMEPILEKMVWENDNLRLVIKPLPVLGEGSLYAAKAVLAAQSQGKFAPFHMALLQERGKLSREKVLEIAASVDLDIEALKKEMDSKHQELIENVSLAQEIGIHGTPAYIVAPHPMKEGKKAIFLPGAVGEKRLREAVKEVLAK